MARKPRPPACCPPKPTPEERPLISTEQAAALGDLFRVFANQTRLRLLHALARSGELCVGELADAVAMKPQSVSNQLQRLADRGILGSRRHGTSILYRIVDPCVTSLLDLGFCLCEDADSRRGASRVVSPAAGPPSPGVSGGSEGD
jgi:DNA-binding transcriptional ArsR family regulator